MPTMGVYAIRNSVSGTLYIGSALNVAQRWKQHKDGLTRRWKTATNKRLLADWHSYGADSFDFILLEVVTTNVALMAAETSWIRSAIEGGVDTYNRGPSSRVSMWGERIDYDQYRIRSIATEPRISTLRRLAKALGVPPEELVEVEMAVDG